MGVFLREKAELVMAVVLIAAAILVAPRSAEYVMSMKAKTAATVVVIDPGHGADDPGKVGVSGINEKDLNLEISLKLREYLEEEGIRVVMTRTEDVSLAESDAQSVKVSDLKRRVEIIEEAQAALAVSIHQNSYTDSSVSGAQVFYYADSDEGAALAGILQESLIENLDPSNTRAAKANTSYYILKKTSVPTVIVECGFLSNAREEALLSEEDYQEKAAQAICEGIRKYLGQGSDL
ncbi:MAG: N-acetylmuramoyl-L-alanine amidase CwlD [Clostridiales bacterium]|nr:N-acetylmuramoyl-L-alanine amidase CwlD [Clostridiales bacterium]